MADKLMNQGLQSTISFDICSVSSKIGTFIKRNNPSCDKEKVPDNTLQVWDSRNQKKGNNIIYDVFHGKGFITREWHCMEPSQRE